MNNTTTTQATTTIQITVPAGTHIGGGPFGMGVILKQGITVAAMLHSAKGTPCTGADWYGFEYGGWMCQVMADRVRVVTPEPEPEPPTTMTATTKRTARETQRVARERVVQQSLVREGTARFNELVEVFTCASTSTPGARYTITHDTVTGAVVCNCPAGEHQRGCLHAEVVTRYLRNRADAINRAADEAVRAHEAMEQRAKDTALLRRETFSFWR